VKKIEKLINEEEHALAEKFLEIEQIELENSITSLGYHDVKINLYSDIYATIKIHVVK